MTRAFQQPTIRISVGPNHALHARQSQPAVAHQTPAQANVLHEGLARAAPADQSHEMAIPAGPFPGPAAWITRSPLPPNVQEVNGQIAAGQITAGQEYSARSGGGRPEDRMPFPANSSRRFATLAQRNLSEVTLDDVSDKAFAVRHTTERAGGLGL
jgi:hypothetical protein